MKHAGKKLTALMLALVLLFSMIPNTVYAVESVGDAQGAMSSIYLPIVPEGEEVFSFFNTGVKYHYASTSAMQVNLRDVTFPEGVGASLSNARVQAVDGDTIIAQSESGTIYGYGGSFNEDVYFLEQPVAGNYALQIVYGDVENLTVWTVPEQYLSVVNAPVITYASIQNLYTGMTPFSLTVRVSGYQGNPNLYTFGLMNGEGTEIACTTVCNSVSSSSSEVYLYYTVTPSQALTEDTYALVVSATSVYANISSVTATVTQAAPETVNIAEVTANDGVTGGLTVVLDNATDGAFYRVKAEYVQYGSTVLATLYEGTLTPVMNGSKGSFDIALQYNGVSLPLTSYDYMNKSIRVTVTNSAGSTGTYECTFAQGNESAYSSVTLTKTGTNQYAFELTGHNMLLDIYANESNTFELKLDGTSLATCTSVTKSTETTGNTVECYFSGTFITTSELPTDEYVQLYINGTACTSAKVKEEENTNQLKVTSTNSVFGWSSFYFNFDIIPLEIVAENGGATAVLELRDANGTVAATTGEVAGVAVDGGYRYRLLLEKPTEFDANKTYSLVVRSGEKEYVVSGAEKTFDATEQVPYSHEVDTPVFAGDTQLVLGLASAKNISLAYYEENPFTFLRTGADTGLSYTLGTPYFSFEDREWKLPLLLAEPLAYGTYKYDSYSSFTTQGSGTPVLASWCTMDNVNRIVTIEGNRNLPEGAYTGILYNYGTEGGKIGDLTLTKNGDVLTVNGLPVNLPNGNYEIEVYVDGTYIGVTGCNIRWNADAVKPTIKGTYRDPETGYSKDIIYEVPTNIIFMETVLTGYAYVRISEDEGFAGAAYQPISSRITFRLSDGEGEKTIYVQFKKADGEESTIYRWGCKRVAEVVTPEILSAEVLVNGSSSMFVPDYTEFVLRLVTNSAMTNAYATFLQEDGEEYYSDEELVYKETTQEGVVYEAVLNTGDYPFSFNDFYGVVFKLTDIDGDTYNLYDTKSVSALFGASGIVLNGWGSDSTIYKNQRSYTVTGYATPGATITVQLYHSSQGYVTKEVTASASGEFSAEFTGLYELSYRVKVSDGLENSISKTLVIDTTAPDITEFKAALDSSGNAAISWECEEANLAGFALWRDGVKIIDEYNNITSTDYIASNAVGSVFELQAFDKAGNSSEKKQISTADTQAPTAPGAPAITAHGTKSISFSWEAATDNVAVFRYEIYRGEILLTMVSYDTLSYTDTGLTAGTEYTYRVYAVDRAGNKSEAANATLATAALSTASSKVFEEQYFIEAFIETKNLPVYVIMKEDSLYDFSKVTATFLYKTEDAQEWSEAPLSGTDTYRDGTWTIYGLEAGNYQVKYKFTDTEGSESFSEVQTVKIIHDNVRPELSVTVPEEDKTYGGKEFKLSGNATDNLILKTVEAFYSVDEGISYNKIATETNTEKDGTLSFTLSFAGAKDLASGEVWIKAVATDIAGNSTSVVRKIVLDNTPPEAPDDFWVGGDKEKITVSWSYPALAPGNDFSHFNVYRSVTGENDSFSVVDEIASIGYFDDLESGVLAETTYYYYVTAEDKYGNESEATLVQSAQLIDDTESPIIRGIDPNNGTLIKSAELIVSATDNYRLDKCVIEYKKDGAAEWTQFAEVGCGDTPVRSFVYHYTWNLSGLEAGNYQVRYTVYDEQENEPATQTVTYTVEAYTAPVAPAVTAQSTGHKTITLSWTYGGNCDLATSFAIYRSENGGSYAYVGAVSVSQDWSYTDKLSFEGETKEFSYKVAVTDRFDATAQSEAVSVTAESADAEKPTPVLYMDNSSYELCGKEISFSADGSTDNDRITAYEWNFGDGKTATGANVFHAYAAAGTYTVQLTVKDAAGNQATVSKTVTIIDSEEEDNYTYVTIHIRNAMEDTAVAGADVMISGYDFETVLRANRGTVYCLLPNDIYTVRVAAQGFLTRSVTITCEGEDTEHIIGLTNSEVMVGEFSVEEMTYDEIVAAGIDVEAEGNQHVYKFKTELSFVAGPKLYTLPLTLYKNNNGETVGKSGGGFFCFPGGGIGGGAGGGDLGDIRLQIDFSEHFVLAIYGEAHWLKEMYHAELTVMNRSYTDTLEDVVARLNLPEGLSLAEMVDGAQSMRQEIGTINHGESKKIDWYIRGDKEGEYHVSADVWATSMPYGELIQQRFSTKEPLKVYAGSALHLTITPDSTAERGKDYNVKFRLENVSDKSLYNVTFGITKAEQYKVMGWSKDGEPITSTDFGDAFTRSIDELAPGGYFELDFSTTIWFNSALELVSLTKLGAFVDIAYYLQDVKVITMEGSTTEIPYTININHKEPDSFIDKAFDIIFEEAYEEYFDEKLPSLDLYDVIEYIGKQKGVDIPMLKEAKMIFKLMQGETDNKMYITIDNGKVDGNVVYNDSVSVTTGNAGNAIIDILNGTSVKVTGREFTVQAKGIGDASFKVGVENSLGKMESEYTVNYNIADREVKNSVTASPGSVERSYQMNEEKWKQTIELVRENEMGELEVNPFMSFDSKLQVKLEGSTSDANYSLTLRSDSVNELLGNTAVSDLEVSGGTANVEMNRAMLKELVKLTKNDVVLIARHLTDEEASELGSTRPTYQFEILCDGNKVSEFGDGLVTVTVPYTPAATENVEKLYVEHILPDGTSERLDAVYDAENGTLTFVTESFSYFRIAYDASQGGESGNTPGGNTPGGNVPGGNVPGGSGSGSGSMGGGVSGGGSVGGSVSGGGSVGGSTSDDNTEDVTPGDDAKEEDTDDTKPEDKTSDDKPEGNEADLEQDKPEKAEDDEDAPDKEETELPFFALTGDGLEEQDMEWEDIITKSDEVTLHLFRYNEKKKTYEYVDRIAPEELEDTLEDSEEEYVVIISGATKAEKVTYKTHTVQHGDTMWKISEKYLGKGSRYKEIMELNDMKSAVLYSGMKLKLPIEEDAEEEIVIGEGSTSGEKKYVTHTVKHGDTMWKIAEKYLGEGSRYKEIMKLNGMTSAMLRSGMVLKLPIEAEDSEVTDGSVVSVEEIIKKLNKQRNGVDTEETTNEKPDAIKPDPTGTSEEKKKVTKYKVKSGDYLRKIAQEMLGDGNRWTEIRDLNKNIKDINKIYPGQELILPEK